jgi:hypothetical protein
MDGIVARLLSTIGSRLFAIQGSCGVSKTTGTKYLARKVDAVRQQKPKPRSGADEWNKRSLGIDRQCGFLGTPRERRAFARGV